MVVSTLQKSFFKEFGLRIRVYDGSSFAESSLTLAQVRKKKGDSKGISIARNIKIGNLENKFEKEFGIKIQIAGSDDSYLCDDNLTLKAAFVEDEKKLGRKARKEAKNTDASETTSDKNIKSEIGNDNSKTYFINHDKLLLDKPLKKLLKEKKKEKIQIDINDQNKNSIFDRMFNIR